MKLTTMFDDAGRLVGVDVMTTTPQRPNEPVEAFFSDFTRCCTAAEWAAIRAGRTDAARLRRFAERRHEPPFSSSSTRSTADRESQAPHTPDPGGPFFGQPPSCAATCQRLHAPGSTPKLRT